MKYVRPDFFDKFVCKADKCEHSCCKGWEIDIDEDTLELFESIDNDIGEEIRANIVRGEQASFRLTDDESCPFLREDGLCRLILTLGEDALCDICAEHPRFYNELSDRTETGVGLCCEEAVRLLLEGSGRLGFLTEDDGEAETPDGAETALLQKREELFELIFSEPTLNIAFEKACALCGLRMPEGKISAWAEAFSKLERLDESWGIKLGTLEGSELTVPDALETDSIALKRLAAYLLYRHFVRYGEKTVLFAAVSAALISAMVSAGGELADTVRQFSSEIEYSDENIDIILKELT